MADKWFVCLKHGIKYGAEYVNTLHSMFRRHASSDIRFACYTENIKGLNKNIEVFPLPYHNADVTGWWYKPMFFNPNLPTQGTLLFCDLDVVIFNDLNKFYEYESNQFCIVRDFTRSMRSNWLKFNSSVFRLETGQHQHVYSDFIANPKSFIRKYHGDQDYIYDAIAPTKDFKYFPDEWTQSYKWEMRKRPEMRRINGVRNFVQKGEPIILEGTSIAVFHGEPNPQQCEDQWVIDNWK